MELMDILRMGAKLIEGNHDDATTGLDIEKITNIEGVNQYILLGPGGTLLSHNMDNHVLVSSMIISCTSICKLITAERFHYLVFAQEDDRDFYIFPVGKHFLAIIKNAGGGTRTLTPD